MLVKYLRDCFDVCCRILEIKADQIINTLLGNSNKPIPGDAPAQGGAVPAGIKEELSAFKNAQSLVQHQLQDLRYTSLVMSNLLLLTCSSNDYLFMLFQTIFGREPR